MIPTWLPVVVPWAGAVLLAALPRLPAPVGPAVAVASLAAAAALVFGGGAAAPDALASALLLAGGVSALLAAAANAGAPAREDRFFTANFPLLQGAQALALLATDAAVAWIGVALCAGAGVVLVALSGGGRRAFAAGWRMLLLCGAGLALALLGVALAPARGAAGEVGLAGLGFVLSLLGYGALAGLAPLNAWLPRAMAASTPAAAAALAGLLPPAALHAILRTAVSAGTVSTPVAPAVLLGAVGLATALLAAFAVWRRPSATREVPGWGAVGAAGLAAVGFGIGGAAGAMAGVLLLLGSPACVGAAVLGPAAGGPVAALGRVSLAGMPPFAPFAATTLLFTAVAALPAGWAVPLGAGLLAATAAQIGAAVRVRGGATPAGAGAGRGGLLVSGPPWLLLAFALALGAAVPERVAAALAEAARLAP